MSDDSWCDVGAGRVAVRQVAFVPPHVGVVVSSGRAFDRNGPHYYDSMKNYDASSDLLFYVIFVIADANSSRQVLI